MNTINTEKINAIYKEEIQNPQRYTGPVQMTKEVLGKALSDAIAKIDKLWDDVHGNFASHASTNNVYDEVENDYGWNEGFFTGMLWLAYEATGDEKYREWGWEMFKSFMNHTAVELGGGFTSLSNANVIPAQQRDNMESFWLVSFTLAQSSHGIY